MYLRRIVWVALFIRLLSLRAGAITNPTSSAQNLFRQTKIHIAFLSAITLAILTGLLFSTGTASALEPIATDKDHKAIFTESLLLDSENANGAANLTFPIAVPNGRNGVTPEISLNYNSQRADKDTFFGRGWDIMGIPFIQRFHNGTDLYDEVELGQSEFELGLGGRIEQLIPTSIPDLGEPQSLLVDQDKTQSSHSGTIAIGNVFDVHGSHDDPHLTYVAQRFTPSKSQIRGIRLKKSHGTIENAQEALIVGIMQDTVGTVDNLPLPSVLDSATMYRTAISRQAWDEIPDDSQFEVLFDEQYAVTSGKDYWIIIATGSRVPDGSIQSDKGFHLAVNTGDPEGFALYWQDGCRYDYCPKDWEEESYELDFQTLYTDVVQHGKYSVRDNGHMFDVEFKDDDSWLVRDDTGTQYTFGATLEARQTDPSDEEGKIHKWMLQELRDKNDNFMRFEYFKSTGQLYPKRIVYTGNGGTDGIYEILFDPFASGSLTERSEKTTSFKPGFLVETEYLVSAISINVNGVERRRYDFSYVSAPDGFTSLLESIVESAWNDEGVLVTKPATTFSYTQQSPGWTKENGWSIPEYFTSVTTNRGYDQKVRFLYANGDNLPDLMKLWVENSPRGGADSVSSVYLNDGQGNYVFDPTRSGNFAYTNDAREATPPSFSPPGAIPVDVNDDGLTDIFMQGDFRLNPDFPDSGSEEGFYGRVFINNGVDGWTEDANWRPPTPLFFYNQNYGKIADINGDNLPDIVIAFGENGAGYINKVHQRIYLNTGSGWQETTKWLLPGGMVFNVSEGIPVPPAVNLIDFNSDGLTDILHQYGVEYKGVWLNNGISGWELSAEYDIENIPSLDLWYKDLRAAEFIQDGFWDAIGVESIDTENHIINNAGNVYQGDNTWAKDAAWEPPVNFLHYTGSEPRDAGVRLVDVNGDGILDIVQSVDSVYDCNNCTKTAKDVYLGNGGVPNLLETIQYTDGSSKTISYTPSSEYQNTHLPLPVQVVSKIEQDDGLGNRSTTTYAYSGGYYYTSEVNAYDSQFAGFHEVTTSLPDGSIYKTYYHQGEGSRDGTDLGEEDDHRSKIGLAYRQEVYDESGNLYNIRITKWGHTPLGDGGYLVTKDRVTKLSFDGDTSHRDTAEEFSYDEYGNIAQHTLWGEVSANPTDGTFSDIGVDKLVTNITYAVNVAENIVSLTSQETVTDQASNKVQETRYYYDGLALGSVDKGNFTKREMWVQAGEYIDIEKTYNSLGQATEEKDPQKNTTSYGYDSFNLYPAIVTNAMGHATRFSYDYASGKVRTKTDANGRVYENSYDGFGRLIEEKVPDLSAPDTLVTKSSTVFADTGMPRKVHTTQYLDATKSFDVIIYLDGFGRIIQVRREAEVANTYAVRDFAYNKVGLREKASLPYFSEGSVYTSATTDSSLYTTFTYDALRRVKSQTNAAGTTTFAYDNWRTTVTDANGNTRDNTYDAYGRLIRVEEHEGADTYTTKYEYDGSGNLANVVDAAGNMRSFTYDGLGRRLRAEDLHAPDDDTYGTWSYTYDAAGNLTQIVDPKSQAIQYTYDALNRTLTENYEGQTGTEVNYSYDSGVNGIGRLTVAVTPDVTTTYAYNAVGDVETETKTINNINYTTAYYHDRQGNTTLIVYPDDSEVRYEYNSAGLLESISQREDGASFSDIVQDFNYNPQEKVTLQKNVNGTETINTYDVGQLYRLVNKATTSTAELSSISSESETYTEESSGSDEEPLTLGQELLDEPWHLSGSGGAAEKYQSMAHDALNGMESVTITYDLHGLCALGGDASAIIFDQDGWQYVSLSEYGTNCHDGEQTVTISLSDFGSLDPEQSLSGTLHTRFWHGSDFNVDITSIVANQTGGASSALPPSDLETERLVNPTNVKDTTPEFSAVFHDPDSGDIAEYYQIQVTTTEGFWTSPLWDSGKVSMTATAVDTRSPEISYGGSPLALDGSTYHWRIKFWDDEGNESDWSAETASFTMASPASSVAASQDLTYSYDNVGNITQIVDTSQNNGAKTVTYTYDDLYRLKQASSTGAVSGGDYTRTYSYDAIGNITDKPDQGVYLYEGNLGTSYANPHAATSISGGSAPTGQELLDEPWHLSGSGGATEKYQSIPQNALNGMEGVTITYDLHGLCALGGDASAIIFDQNGWQYVSLSEYGTNCHDGEQTVTIPLSDFGSLDPEQSLTGSLHTRFWYGSAFSVDITSIVANPVGGRVGATLTYDRNGNLTGEGTWAYTWDYNNRLVSATSGTETTTYGYNQTGQRVVLDNGTVITVYPNKLYNTDGATVTKHIFIPNNSGRAGFGGDQLVATIQGSGADAEIRIIHPDHLGGTHVVSDQFGYQVELSDYYPYGGIRLDEKSGTSTEQRKFTGQEYDEGTNLHYYVQRYYNQDTGRFLSQDPVSRGANAFSNPQFHNSYAYASNNPLRFTDPEGEFSFDEINGVVQSIGGYADPIANQVILGNYSDHTTALGTAGQVAAGFFGVDLLGDVRDLTYDIQNWEWSKEHLLQTGMDSVGLLPVVGALKYGDEVAQLTKNADDVSKELHRPYIRQSVRKEVEHQAPRGPNGKFLDPNTGLPIDGKYDLGHTYGNEFWRLRENAQQQGLNQKQFNDLLNNPKLYQIENPSTNRSHQFEKLRK